MDNPKETLPEGRENSEKTENTQRRKLNDATFEPRSLIEQTGDYEQSETIQNTFGGLMDNLQNQGEAAMVAVTRLPGEANRSQPEQTSGEGVKGPAGGQVSITPINLPNIADGSEAGDKGPGGDPTSERGMRNSRVTVAEPPAESIDQKGTINQTAESDLTSEKQMKLQEMMEQKTQIEQTLSNVEKKFEDTQRDLIANIK
jgi:hypothetical protein